MPDRVDAPPLSVQERRAALASLPRPDAGAADDLGRLLFEGLGDDDFGVRQEAVTLALRAGPVSAVLDALERALCDESSLSRRSSAMEAFGKLGAAAVPSLARLFADERPGVRRLALDALGLTRAPQGFDVLVRGSNDPAPAVRAASLEALARLGGERAAARIEEVVVRRDEPATVVLAGLLALDGLGRVMAPKHVRPHLADALTAAPALRLLGRAGETTPLIDVLVRGRGARRRAAAVGLANALAANPQHARHAVTAARERIEAPLLELCEEADLTVAGASLVVSAAAGMVEAFALIARRSDRGLLGASVHRAAAAFASATPNAAERLRQLAAREQDASAAALLDEVAEGLSSAPPVDASAGARRGPAAQATPFARPPSLFSVDRPPLGEEEFAKLSALFLREAGLLFEHHAAWRIEARLAPLLKGVARSWAEYLEVLEQPTPEGKAALAAALERVTVHETYFFRERHQLDSFAGEVLPALLGRDRRASLSEVRRLSRGTIRVLSAGCATGEEAFTIAILLEESGYFGGSFDYEVVGVDVAPGVVAAAREGRYGTRGFRGDVPEDVMRRWFRFDGRHHVVTGLEGRVRFEVANLLDREDLARHGHFDVVFCRNVLIYMSDDARTAVVRNLFERLHPGGVLFLGHSESLLNVESGFRFLPLERELAYLRPLEAARRSS